MKKLKITTLSGEMIETNGRPRPTRQLELHVVKALPKNSFNKVIFMNIAQS